MPRGVYPRHAGFGDASRQRAARRRELQERQAQEIERLEGRLRYHRTATRRAAGTIRSQRLLLNGLAAFRELLAGLADADHLWDRPECDASAHVLLASIVVGAAADRIAVVTGLPRAVIIEREQRLRRSGVWVGERVRARYEDPDGGGDLRFALDVLVAEGDLYRSWDAETYSVEPIEGPDLRAAAAPAPARRRKGQHALQRLADVQPCPECVAAPAYRGVCAEHILTVHIDDLRRAWGCGEREVYSRRWRILGLCKTCRTGPLYSSGYCERHYRQHVDGNRQRKRQRRRWVVSRDEIDQWTGAVLSEADAALFDRLLADLLRSVPAFPPHVGRPRHPIGVVLFAVVTMARTNASTRAVQPLLEAARAAGHLAAPISYNALVRYLGADVATLLAPTRAVLATVNVALAALGVEPGYPTAAAPIAVSAEASPVWMRLLGVAATRRTGRPIDLAAREPVDDEGSVELLLGRIVRSLGKVVAVVRERGIEGWLAGDAATAPGSRMSVDFAS